MIISIWKEIRTPAFLWMLLTACVFIDQPARAQLYLADSLKKVLHENPGTEKAEILYELGDAYFKVNKDTAILYLQAGYEYSLQEENLIMKSRLSGALSRCYLEKDPVKCAEFTLISMQAAEQTGNPNELASASRTVAIYYRYNGDLEKSREYYEKCHQYNSSIGDSIAIARDYNGLGIVDMMTGNYDEGLEKWQKSLGIKLRHGMDRAAANSMSNIALYYKDIGRYKEADDYLNQSISILLDYDDYEGLAYNYQIKGEMYLYQENYAKSVKYLDTAQLYFDKINATLARLEVYLDASKAYEGLGDYEKALANLRGYVRIANDVNNEATARISRELGAKYESEKKERENLELKNENHLQQNQIEEEERNLVYMSIGIGVIVLVMFVILLMLRKVRQAKGQVEIQKAVVENKNQEITDSIEYAKRLQEAILPSQDSIDEKLKENFVLYLPKDIVAGDFYWMEAMDNGDVLIAAADCTGHGVPGAMVSVVCHNALNRSVREFGFTDPGEVLDKTTDLVIETFEKSGHEVKDGMDICLCLITHEGNVKYAGAHNSLYHMTADDLLEIKASKQPIGKYDNRQNFESRLVDVKPGETLYLFTDGYADQFGGEKGKKLKYKNFKEKLKEYQGLSMADQRTKLKDYFLHWRGDLEQLDDVCVIGIRF